MLHQAADYSSLWQQIDYSKLALPKYFNIADACLHNRPADQIIIKEYIYEHSIINYTWGDLEDLSARVGNVLLTYGITKGDRVAILYPQSFYTAALFLGIWRIGAITLPISSVFGAASIVFRLSDSGASALITDLTQWQKLCSIVDSSRIQPFIIDAKPADPYSFESAIRRVSPKLEPVHTCAEDGALLIYTSGTTSKPKGVLHAHRIIFGQMPIMEMCYGFLPKEGDAFWSVADWAWIAGVMAVMLPGLLYNIPLIVDRNRGFDPQRAVDLMRSQNITLTLLPATALRKIRASNIPGGRFAMRTIMSGGEPLGAELRSWADFFFGCAINDGYGQTEMNALCAHSSSVFPIKPGAVGRPVPGGRIMVVDDTFHPVFNQLGRIVAWRHTPATMVEYWNNPQATAEKFHGDWLITGDLGLMDSDGYLWFKSRDDDIINASGYRIGPAEIEDCLCSSDSVAQAAVVGVHDPDRGQTPKAFVVLTDSVLATDVLREQLRDAVRGAIGTHAVPKEIEFVSSLPTTATGKVLRRVLRKGFKASVPGPGVDGPHR